MPKVSICIPTYNNILAFKRCFESVLMQSYTDYEIIITDDSTNHEIKTFLNKQPSLKNVFYYKNQTSLGSPENWNESIRKANGEYIKILHHDDWFTHKSSLEIFVKLLDENPSTTLAFTSSRNYDLDKNKVINYNKPSSEKIEQIKNTPITLLNGNYIGAPSATIFRNIDYAIFDTSTIWFVDIDFYIQILSKNSNLAYSSVDAISIGISTTQITKSVENDRKINIFEHFHLLNKWNINHLIDSPFEKSTYLLLKKFSVNNKRKIRNLGFYKSLPVDINKLFIRILLENIREKLKKIKTKFYK